MNERRPESKLFVPMGRKRATNVSLNRDLLEQARAYGINLSSVLERALLAELRVVRRAQWLQENRDAIDAYNERIARVGVFSDSVRRF